MIMTYIDPTTLAGVILLTEPDYFIQAELQVNGMGEMKAIGLNETVWVWSKERIRNLNGEELLNLAHKLVS